MSARKTCRSVAIYIYVRLLHIVELFFNLCQNNLLGVYCYFRTTSIQRRFCGYLNYTVEDTEIFQRQKTKKQKKHQKKPLKIKKKRNIKWKFFKVNILNSLEIVYRWFVREISFLLYFYNMPALIFISFSFFPFLIIHLKLQLK